MNNQKIIISKNILELYVYNYNLPKPKKNQRIITERNNTLSSKIHNITRARNNLKRLVICNFDKNSVFVTLTYRDNITSIEESNYFFMTFIKRLKYYYPDIKYVVVPEFQKRGAVHYHGFFNLNEVGCSYSHFRRIWNYGFCYLKTVYKLDNAGAYILKYLTKEQVILSLCGKRSFLASRGLERSVEIKGIQALPFLLSANKIRACSYVSKYPNKFNNQTIFYYEFNFDRLDFSISQFYKEVSRLINEDRQSENSLLSCLFI